MPKFLVYIIAIVLLIAIGLGIFFSCTPNGHRAFNKYKESLHKADDETDYETRKKVEDSCRAMIANYDYYVLTYNQYKDSTDPDEKGWANEAKMSANRTASTYNNYYLQNSYVWKDNVPSDIRKSLEYVGD